jgi:DNA polymerase-3 subunit gamma/tau
MLSKGAFNALLKILEEPPRHVKFILATTEIHKVPDTILSRCQRYDFKNFSNSEIKGRLEYIADQEKVTVDNESYDYIVKNAEGGMRNAVSLFEQLISSGNISYAYIVETL